MKKIISAVIAFAVVSSMSVVSMAATSPTATEVTTAATTVATTTSSTTVTHDYNGGTVVAKTDPNSGRVTFTVSSKDGYTFTGWNIPGDYKIISGSLDSETIVVEFLDGTTAETALGTVVAEFEEDEESTTGETTTKKDDEGTSPKTGDASALVLLIGAAALGTVVLSKKKLEK